MRATRLMICAAAIGATFLSVPPISARTPAVALATDRNALVARAQSLGATNVTGKPAPNGGTTLNGKLGG
ncbi:MAG: hypothetical protein PSY12_08655, partial [bacterium]|nr:hypothetical protein [bacterium]